MTRVKNKLPLTPIDQIMRSLLKNLGMSEDTVQRGKAFTAWEKIAGEAASHSRTVRFRGSVLLVAVGSPSRLHELSTRKTELLRRMEKEIGKGIVTDLRFYLDRE